MLGILAQRNPTPADPLTLPSPQRGEGINRRSNGGYRGCPPVVTSVTDSLHLRTKFSWSLRLENFEDKCLESVLISVFSLFWLRFFLFCSQQKRKNERKKTCPIQSFDLHSACRVQRISTNFRYYYSNRHLYRC